MANFIGRVVDEDNEPIDGAKVSLEFQGTPPVVYTDAQGMFRFPVNLIGSGNSNGRIRVEANGYKTNNRLIELSPNNLTIEDFRLRNRNSQRRLSPPIIIAIIGAAGVILAALITAGLPSFQKSSTPERKDNQSLPRNSDLSSFVSPSLSPSPGVSGDATQPPKSSRDLSQSSHLGTSKAKITTDEAVYQEGDPINFKFSGLEKSEWSNRIDLTLASVPRRASGYKDTKNVGEEGSGMFKGVAPGEYELRAFHQYRLNEFKFITSQPITVK